MKKVIYTIAIAAFATVLISSCAKPGCTDKNATNYNASAKKDDGTCNYEGSVVFWYGKTSADELILDGSTALTYYVDGILVGSSAASVYWTGAPECGQAQSITSKKDLGIVKTKTHTYSIKDQAGDIIWAGTQTWTANTCLKLELTY